MYLHYCYSYRFRSIYIHITHIFTELLYYFLVIIFKKPLPTDTNLLISASKGLLCFKVYSLLSASNGSLLAAYLDGIRPVHSNLQHRFDIF